MNEAQVIALAGVFQAAALVRMTATTGSQDATALETSIASVMRIDVDEAADAFGGVARLRLGLETLVQQLDRTPGDLAASQIAVSVLRVERKLAGRPSMLQALREGIEAIQRQVDHLGVTNVSVLARLSELYANTLSNLRPRVIVQGNPLYLQQPAQVERIRATLLAGVRAAVLWRQLGGSQWQLLFKRRQAVMLARGLLSRARLDGG
ncbi:MAG: lysogenization regulator HflD [Lysobacterales bacterium 69-70]|nr:high frequency lysogenization protein HflD [Xanthomonadaceae bacterium]ODU34847.1 MAG: lysogenization regulator HflD [Xanthomonadaceae bacterium SCN 69-320]ODV19804.1 MAG: lysogenization regulator HflD [Xanthomonadaceae bacterium SCN 69-25]OJY95320.1 MAG: lysogenization regulator HflD [Xanthomonadales bacterium 69-70]